MSDPFLDSIEKSLENGEVPQRVTNRQLLAGLRIVYGKENKNDKRLTLLERWQSKANGAIAASVCLAGGGLMFTVGKLLFP
jgi:hypothetical protein